MGTFLIESQLLHMSSKESKDRRVVSSERWFFGILCLSVTSTANLKYQWFSAVDGYWGLQVTFSNVFALLKPTQSLKFCDGKRIPAFSFFYHRYLFSKQLNYFLVMVTMVTLTVYLQENITVERHGLQLPITRPKFN